MNFMNDLTTEECELIFGGGDLFLYDVFYVIGKVYQECLETVQKEKSTTGSNMHTIQLKMGGL